MAWTLSAPLLLVGAVAAVADPCIKPGVRPQPFHLSLWRVLLKTKEPQECHNIHGTTCTLSCALDTTC
jgi:hypothetical protein